MYRRSTKTKRVSTGVTKRFASRRVMFVIVFGVVVMSVSLAKEVIRKIEIKREIASLEAEIAELEQHNAELNTMMAYFNSSSFQAKEAKAKLNLVEPGETVVVLPNQAADGTVSVVSAHQAAAWEALPNYQKWVNYFFN